MALLEFYGEECPHCEKMMSKVEQLEEEEGVNVEQLEVWHDEDNAERMQEFDQDDDGEELCGGVPFFYNTESGEWICGETDIETLKTWANGGEVN